MSDQSTSPECLGARLKEAREYRGYSQEEVAWYLDLPRSAISLMESGSGRVADVELRRLAKLYQTTMKGLIGHEQDSPEPESVRLVTKAAADLSASDREEVLRFVRFLQSNSCDRGGRLNQQGSRLDRRSEILRATSEAADLLARFPPGRRTSFDIVGAVTEHGSPLVFRPLEGLLGAVVTMNGMSGIMITTNRALQVQRFTLAHELGHILLGHPISIDHTIEFAGQETSAGRPPEEVAVDTFASRLLGSKKLVLASAQRQQWSKEDLHRPENIYQLSLRLGISYQATCWALVGSEILTPAKAHSLLKTQAKHCKQALAPEAPITNSRADVWSLTEADTGTLLEAVPDDLFAIHLRDHASAGYLWQLADSASSAVVVGEHRPHPNHAYGGRSSRVMYVRFNAPGRHRLVFEHVRPWSRATLGHIEIDIDGHGKERAGHARRFKRQALDCAA